MPSLPVTALQGRGQIDDLHPFAGGLFDLMGKGGHLFPGPAVDDGHFGPQPPGGAGHVDGHVAAADDRQPFPHRQGFFQVGPAQELHALDHAVGILAGNPQGLAHVAADPQEHGLIAFFQQPIHRKIPAQGGVGLQFHPQAQDVVDFPVQDIFGQAVVGDAHPEHAARPWAGPRKWWGGSLSAPGDRRRPTPPGRSR